MREDCKHYESRTYDDGETVRKCGLDLAPEAPWRCPTDCGGYEPRLADVNWEHRGLVSTPVEDEPEELAHPEDGVAELLDEAEDIVNDAVPGALADLAREERRPWWRRRRRG
jgi:hypothetical protein